MGFIKKIKDWFGFYNAPMGEIELETSTTELESKPEPEQQEQHEKTLDKFDAEFHNPRLLCFYCNQLIESGRVRFKRAPGQKEENAFHKRCFKKLKQGILPGEREGI